MRTEIIFKIRKKMNRAALLLLAAALCLCSVFASADSLSADNSLSSLGITTEGAVVSPEFAYGTTTYDVTVPAGTTSLSLSPTTSNSAAYIDSITGTDLTDGSATVSIVVVAENGDAFTYTLNVTAEAAEVETEAQTETEVQTETETEKQTEDSRYVSVARETLEEAENTIDTLKTETRSYRDRVDLLTKILYGMIALCVVLLFIVINLLLKNKDLKSELKNYRGLNYSSGNSETEDWEEEKPKKEAKQKKGKKKKEKKPVIVEDTRHQQEQETYEEDAFDDTDRGAFYDEEDPWTDQQYMDDPTTVPKPSKARNQAKRMPEYEQSKGRPRYEQQESQDGSGEVDIDYIDL
ncbi:MAG: cadherin-like beta sandwich domain-containing protein [Lachnospiraceae bacterium]|nr:cadherin-like beta sandwich domain-containing protein [Lachnospiraceae bacterium]